MKSSQGTDRVVQPAKLNQLTVSERKLKANRENARKSTGPKTPRGKAFSRRNAVKQRAVCAIDFRRLRHGAAAD
jgi:hypothetical protein